MNAKFVSLKIDAEKGEGPALKDRFKVEGYPTALIVDPVANEEVDRIGGYSPPDKYLALLRDILEGRTFQALKTRAASHPDDLETWSLYAEKLEDQGTREEQLAAWGKVAALDADDRTDHGPHARLRLAVLEAYNPWVRDRDMQPLLELATRYDGKPTAIEAHKVIARLRGDSKDPVSRQLAAASYEYVVAHGKPDAEMLNSYAWLLVKRLPTTEKSL